MNKKTVPQDVLDYFSQQTREKEPLAVFDNCLDMFDSGIAHYIEEPIDQDPRSSLRNTVEDAASRLIPNFRQSRVIGNVVIPSVLDSDTFPDQVQEQLQISPIVFIVTHPSIASPYIAKRKINFLDFNQDVAKRVYSVAGPRPMTLKYNLETGLPLSPFMLGVALGNVALTGPNTESVDDAPDTVKDWLKQTGRDFKENLHEITEPKAGGDNNAIVICSAGKIARHNASGAATEYRMRTTKYLEDVADKVVFWPIGMYDELLIDHNQPSSIVGINPSPAPFRAKKEDEIFTMQQIAVDLSQFPFGHMRLESALSSRTKRGIIESGNVLKRAYNLIRPSN